MAGNKLNFTKGNIDSLPLPEKKYTMYHDEKTPGLVLRVYPSGVKSFFLYRWTNRKPEYVSIGRYLALTPDQARRKAAELNAEIGAEIERPGDGMGIVSLDLKLWNIPAAQSKNKTAYTVPLVSPALEILARRKSETSASPWVFPSDSKTGHFQEPKKAWGRILKTSGLDNLRMHDLRRSLGSWMAITGASLLTISHALGHKLASLSVMAVYARANVDPIRTAMETATRAMLRKGGVLPEEDTVIQFKQSV